jgi:hypothetical protein
MAGTMAEPRVLLIPEPIRAKAAATVPVHHLRVVVPVVEAAAVALQLEDSNLKDQQKSKRTLTILWPTATQGFIYPFL